MTQTLAGTVVVVDVGGLDEARGRAALTEASRMLGIDASASELIRLGTSATFRLPGGTVVARVGRNGDLLADAAREVAVARWLASVGVPAIRALDVEQPVVAGRRLVTFWESASDQPEYGTPAELAALLRRLHALTAPADLELPPVDPFRRASPRIDKASSLSEDDREFLQRRCAELVDAYAGLNFELPPGVVHGDASVGNVIRDRDGRPLFADLDGFAVGPREWDLVLTALYFERFGWHTAEEYAAFVEAYGYDVMAWGGYRVLADVREFLMVTWLSQNAETDPKVARELERRISDLRRGASRKGWQPF
jgi:aminoglycoside phosphotransferase (APT) family kinase protein